MSQLAEEGGNLIKQVVELAYFMRGAIQYDRLMLMSIAEKEIVGQFLKDRMDTEMNKPNHSSPIY